MPFKNELSYQEYVYDFDVDGGVKDAALVLSDKPGYSPLPVGALVKSVLMKVETLFESGGAATLVYGNDGDPDGYSGATVALGALTANSLHNGWDNAAALLWDDTNDHQLQYYVNTAANGSFEALIETADMTAGKATYMVEYYLPAGL